MAKEGLYFQFKRLRFTEFINVKLCDHCLGYLHTIKFREARENESLQRCDNCGERKPQGVEDDSRRPKCHQCTIAREEYEADYVVNHVIVDKRCLSFQRKRELIIERTDYGK
ncbi:hypothetical protein AVEN_175451-1 [Araneus ventricosus]|uniref:Uncharacterized protein n=1 Tax=Araneus ventricosus TaxID=182803 RepID=A0A4Y2XBF0_ARAVE|nr:hypothetical protein AVEN_175451-1 [Araneus ventricosus]